MYDPKPDAEFCYATKHLKDLGYRSGHKTRYCQNRGYDTNEGWICVRDCLKSCIRADIKKLGWIKDSKTKFCVNLGYDGVHGAAGSEYQEGGYCYKKVPVDCKI